MGSSQEMVAALTGLAPDLAPNGKAVSGLKRLSGGASQETWAFDVFDESGAKTELILRRTPGGREPSQLSGAIGLEREAQILAVASARGVRVPRVVHVCSPGEGIGIGYVMERLSGETIAPKILRQENLAEARSGLAKTCGEELAKIHAIERSKLPDLPEAGGGDQLKQYSELYFQFDVARPVMDLAIAWLAENIPAPASPVLVHGDFRLGNLMVAPKGLNGVLDWELAHIGDPREDLAWICINSWRFGNSHRRVGGFGDLSDLLAGYVSAGGAHIEASEIDWWEVLGSLKWGVMCLIMYETFRSGADPSVERAAIGRRASEAEIDILNLLERLSS